MHECQRRRAYFEVNIEQVLVKGICLHKRRRGLSCRQSLLVVAYVALFRAERSCTYRIIKVNAPGPLDDGKPADCCF